MAHDMDTRRTLRGAALLYEAINQIIQNPRSWDQTVVWHDGNRHCLFGICELVAGIRTRPDRIFDEVRRLIGISESDGYWLASPERTLEQIRWFAGELAAGRVGQDHSKGFDIKAWDRLDARFRRWSLGRIRSKRLVCLA